MANKIEIIVSLRDSFTKGLSSMGKSVVNFTKLVVRMSKIVGVAFAAIATFGISSFMKFESAFAGVRKTVEATEKEFQFLSASIRQMALEIPATTVEISRVAEAAGQLGIQKGAILTFTRTMVDLGNTTNLSADQAATALARFSNITGFAQEEVGRLGSTVVDLGNNLATTEGEILNMALRIASAGKIVGLAEADILSFAGAMSAVGIRAQLGGTAFSKVMKRIAKEVAQGGDNIENFADVTGKSVEEFSTLFKEDAREALLLFIEGLGRVKDAGKDVFTVLDDMGIINERMQDTLLRAAGAGDKFRIALDRGTKAFKENTALTEEAAKRYKTLESRWTIFKSQIKDIAISLGEDLEPAFRRLMDSTVKFAKVAAVVFINLPEIIALSLAAVRDLLFRTFTDPVYFKAFLENASILGVQLLEGFGNVLIEMGALVLKVSAVLFSPLIIAARWVFERIRFAWQFHVDKMLEIWLDAVIFWAEKVNAIPILPDIPLDALKEWQETINEVGADVPRTLNEIMEEWMGHNKILLGSAKEDLFEIGDAFSKMGGVIKDTFGDIIDLPEFDALFAKLDALIKEAGTKIVGSIEGEILDPLKKETENLTVSLEEIWAKHFENWLGQWQDATDAIQEMSKTTWEGFKQGVGDAVAAAIVFAEDLGESIKNVLKAVVANIISSLVQIGIQQMIQTALAKVILAKDAGSKMAALAAETYAGAFTSVIAALPFPYNVAAAPIVAATQSATMISGGVAAGALGSAAGTAIVGAAHGGLENVPQDATFLLRQGERVVSPRQNRDLEEFMQKGGGVFIKEFNLMKDVSFTEALFNMPKSKWVQLTRKRILPALNVLGDNKATTSLKQRETFK